MWNEKKCFPHFGIGVLQQFGTTWHVAKIVLKNHCTLMYSTRVVQCTLYSTVCWFPKFFFRLFSSCFWAFCGNSFRDTILKSNRIHQWHFCRNLKCVYESMSLRNEMCFRNLECFKKPEMCFRNLDVFAKPEQCFRNLECFCETFNVFSKPGIFL